MKRELDRLLPQPLLGIAMSLLGLVTLAYAWTRPTAGLASALTLPPLALALTLGAVVVFADRFPIHFRQNLKVTITTTPLYLSAVLLPPALAGLTAGLSILIAEVMMRSKHDTRPSDIATATGRWIIIASLASLLGHPHWNAGLLSALVLVGVAGFMLGADMFTSALEVAPMSHEPVWHVLLALAKEGTGVEGAQYLVGILGALAALQGMWVLLLLSVPALIIYLSFKNSRELRNSTRVLLENMADTVDLRDPYTGGHSRRVAEYCAGILRELQLPGIEADIIISAARMHDIGKVAVPDDILKKPGRLEAEERRIMEAHARAGATLLSGYPDFRRGRDMVCHHHERWDGSGYPDHLKSYDIPLGARVIAVADAFDAMTSDRPYRKALSLRQAAAALRQESGRQWDPRVVEALLQSIHAQLAEPLVREPVSPAPAQPRAVTVEGI
jgi:HD domain